MRHDVHIIRLRGPWQLEPLESFVPVGDGRIERSTVGLPPSARATMPADWAAALGVAFLGRMRYTRKFHEPEGREPHETVWLVVEPPRSHGIIRLNGHHLGEVAHGQPPGRFDITPLLVGFNTLEIEVVHPLLDEQGRPTDDSDTLRPGGLIGEVQLEIEE